MGYRSCDDEDDCSRFNQPCATRWSQDSRTAFLWRCTQHQHHKVKLFYFNRSRVSFVSDCGEGNTRGRVRLIVVRRRCDAAHCSTRGCCVEYFWSGVHFFRAGDRRRGRAYTSRLKLRNYAKRIKTWKLTTALWTHVVTKKAQALIEQALRYYLAMWAMGHLPSVSGDE